MNRNFERALALVLKHEGGWADHPKDPGGATMKGITIAVYRKHVNPNATKADLRKISDAEVRYIYRKLYWDKVRGDDLPDGVDYAVFDFAVNSGVSRASKFLQAVLKVRQDGVVGPGTIEAARKADAATVINRICDDRMTFLKGLGTWGTFGKGWTSRVAGVRAEALSMAKVRAAPAPAPVPAPEPKAEPAPSKPNWLAALLAFLGKILGKIFHKQGR